MPKTFGRQLLISANRPTLLLQRDFMMLAVNISGEVFGRPTEFKQRLFEKSSLSWMNHNCFFIQLHPKHRGDFFASGDFTKYCWINRSENETVNWMRL